MAKLRDFLGKQALFLDGGSGSVLQGWGLKPGELPETWNVIHPEKIKQLHYDYFAAGSNVVYTNTFGAYSTKFADTDSRQNVSEQSSAIRAIKAKNDNLSLKNIIECAVKNAKDARSEYLAFCLKEKKSCQPCFVALDIGPCGHLLKPMGDLDFEDAVTIFKTTIRYGVACDVDAIFIETMNDAYETKAAVIAAKEALEEANLDLPILVTNVYDQTCHLLTGADPETMVAILEGLGVDALGLNCSLGPEEMKESVRRLVAVASVPVIVKPNAGLPREVDGKTVFDVGPEDFAKSMGDISKMGAAVFGGCCGTTPNHIKALKHCLIKNEMLDLCQEDREVAFETVEQGVISVRPVQKKNETVISSYTKVVKIGGENVPCLIGERINPTGKKKFKEALRAGDIPYIIHQGLEQEQAGAHVLDVNVGLPEIDEKEMMVRVMTELQGVTDLPLQIDTSSAEVMEAALRRYNGKPLINSVNGKQHVMDEIFPLVKKYGGVVVALTIDERGIPETAEGRIRIIKKIYENAEKWGIERKNILIDALTMAVSSDTNAAIATLECVRSVRDDFGGNTILGVSNISFGLPEREFVTASFFTLAMHNGLGAAIMNPLSAEMMKAWHCFVLLKGKDKDCLNYIQFAQEQSEKKKQAELALQEKIAKENGSLVGGGEKSSSNAKGEENSTGAENDKTSLQYAVIHGLKDDAATRTKVLLESGLEAVDLIDSHLIPGLDFVGKRFEAKTMYLPQLLMAADAAKSAFGVIKEYLEKSGKKGEPKGTCIVATVHGDIHDIGKNIVKVLLENYDFTVIDLGKDVPPEVIVERCKKDHVELVGLSALMTTTVPAMKATIELLRKEAPWAKVCVGGAVMTQEYADSIGADFYGKDAMATVSFAQKVFGVK